VRKKQFYKSTWPQTSYTNRLDTNYTDVDTAQVFFKLLRKTDHDNHHFAVNDMIIGFPAPHRLAARGGVVSVGRSSSFSTLIGRRLMIDVRSG